MNVAELRIISFASVNRQELRFCHVPFPTETSEVYGIAKNEKMQVATSLKGGELGTTEVVER